MSLNASIRKTTWLGLFFGIAISMLTSRANSQTEDTGNIQGMATDESEAVIPNALITTVDTATRVKRTTNTDGNGFYSFPNLTIGTYNVEVAATSFNSYRQSNIILDVGSSVAVTIMLKVGDAEQTVEIQASGLALQTEDSSLKQTVDQHTLTELPLNGRQITDLVTLMGGAVNANENNDVPGSKTGISTSMVQDINMEEGSSLFSVTREGGRYEFDPYESGRVVGTAKDGDEIVRVAGAPLPNSLGPDDDDVGHLVNWLQATQTRAEPNATADHGFSHSLVCIMAAQSYWSGKKLYWDPRSEQILDHPVAKHTAGQAI